MKAYVEYPPVSNPGMYNESEFIRLVCHARKLHERLNSYSKKLLLLLPVHERLKLFPDTYFLTAYNLAHIIERHYNKKDKHTDAGKFTIPLVEIHQYIRLGFIQPAQPLIGVQGYKRVIQTGKIIGVTRSGQVTNTITVVSDAEGRIRTAYPDSPINEL